MEIVVLFHGLPGRSWVELGGGAAANAILRILSSEIAAGDNDFPSLWSKEYA